jgi:predicted DNA binding protein
LETYEQLQQELSSASSKHSSRIISKSLCEDKFQLVARTCYCGAYGASAGTIIDKHNFMEVPPTVLMGGWEHYRLVGFDDSDVKGLLKSLDRIGKTEVLRKKPLSENVTDDNFLLSLSSLFGQLTEKQLKALLSAVENGYYEIPKRVTADQLAKKQGQPRSTLEEHIRKAESKVVMAMAPYMMMYAGVPGSPFSTATKAAGETVGARRMKELAIQIATKGKNS